MTEIKFNQKYKNWWIFALFITISLCLGYVLAQSLLTGIILSVLLISLFVTLKKTELVVYLWIFSSILYAYRVELGTVSVNPYRSIFLLLVLALPFQMLGPDSIFKRKREARKTSSRTILYLLLLFGIFIIGWARTPSSEMPLATSQLMTLIFGLGAFFYLLQFVSNENRLQGVVKVYLFSATIVAAYGIYESLSWFFKGSRPSLPLDKYAAPELAQKISKEVVVLRAESFFHDSNLLGVYLAMAVILLIPYIQVKNRSRFPVVLLLGVLILTGCIVFTISRSAILLLCAGFLLVQFKGRRIYGKQQWVKVVSISIIFILLFYAFYLLFPILPTYLDAFSVRLSKIEKQSKRATLAEGGIKAFSSSPIMGVGIGNMISEVGSYTSHSFYITILAEFGIVGAIAVCLFLWPLIRELTKTILFSKGNKFDLSFSVAALILLIYQIVYDNLFSELMWLPFSMLYIWALLKEQKSNFNKISSERG